MTTLSSVSASTQTVAASVARTATPSGSNASSTTPQSATTVSLGQSNAAITAQLYSLPTTAATPVAPPPLWEHDANDPISKLMAGNNNAASLAVRFKGLGAAMLSRFDTEAGNFSQSVAQFAPGTQMGSALEGITQSQLHKTPDNQIKLTVQTVGGAQVELTLGSTENGLAVDVNVTNGKLSDADREALSKLSGGFQKAIDGLAANPPRMDLSGLTQFDSTVLASVDLHAAVQVGGSDKQVIDFHADAKQRSVSSSGPIGNLKVAVDLSNPALLGSAKQQAQAISSYLKQFDKAQNRGHGDGSLMTMFKDAFSELNSNYPTNAAQQQAGMPGVKIFNAEDHSLLTGLADFSASVSQSTTFSNPMRSEESDTFSYQVSQNTSIQGKDQLNRSLTQRQQSHLSASYHEALQPDLPLRLTTDKSSQNYTYTQINDSASSTASITYGLGALIKASLTQSASQSTRVQKYVMGNLESDKTTPLSATWTMDFLAQFKAAQSSDNSRTSADNYRWEQALESIHNLTVLQSDPGQLSGSRGLDYSLTK